MLFFFAGLYDQNPADILSRQGLTGPSPSGKIKTSFLLKKSFLKMYFQIKVIFLYPSCIKRLFSITALQAIASRTGGNPSMISSSMAARAAQRPMASPPASSTSFKSSPSSATSSAANRANRSRFMSSTSSLSRKDEDDSDSDDEIGEYWLSINVFSKQKESGLESKSQNNCIYLIFLFSLE